MSDRRSLAGTSLAAETDESRDEESRLKAGCSQDWLPHKARGFLESVNAARISACATVKYPRDDAHSDAIFVGT